MTSPWKPSIIVTFGENANMRWEKIIIICFLACHWCINTTKTTTSYFSITISIHGVTGVSFNDLTSIFRAEVICEISILSSCFTDFAFLCDDVYVVCYLTYIFKTDLNWPLKKMTRLYILIFKNYKGSGNDIGNLKFLTVMNTKGNS